MKCNIPNRKSGAETAEEEMALRQEIAKKMAKIMKVMLRLLKPMVGCLPDPRDQRYITYSKESLFLYGIMMFSLKASSRRDANRFMTDPIIQANLKAVIPGLDAIAHNDTLAKYLERIEPDVIQEIYHTLIRKLLRNKEFRNMAGRFKVLVDGSGKGSKDWKYSDKALHRGNQSGEVWLTYVMEAVLVMENGMVIPLCTEFLENSGCEFDKQDCELKAWRRMAPKLHRLVGDGATVIFDGLYANGPVIMQCKKYKWDYMITLKDGSMPRFVEDARGIMECEPANMVTAEVGGRRQVVRWANAVEFEVSRNHTYIGLNVVSMEESWMEVHTVTGKRPEYKKVTYQWISSAPVNKTNALNICSDGRARWLIENNFKTEKHGGYGFEHYFSLNWDVNKAYHYFMKFGHFINAMLMSSEELSNMVLSLGGIGGFLAKIRLVLSGFVLDADSVRSAVLQPFRWRLDPTSIYMQAASPP